MRRILSGLLALLCCLTVTCSALAETAFLPDIEGWALDDIPLELTLSADVTAYGPFDEERLPQLTNLIKHLALRVSWQPLIDETQSFVSLLADGEEALSFGLQKSALGGMLQFSFLPDVTYSGVDPLAALLGAPSEPFSILGLNGTEAAWVTEGYALLTGLETALAPYLSEEANVKTNISDMGTARLKRDYTVSKDDAPALTALLLSVCPEGRLRETISGLVFSGKQTLRVYLDANHVPLRMEWNGHCGLDEEHQRNVKLTWRLRRDDTAYRDEITLTAPALKGTDNHKLTWTCSVLPNKAGQMVLTCSLDYARTANKEKTTLTGSCKLTAIPEENGTRVTGEASLSRQLPDQESATGYSFTPSLLFAGDANLPTIDGTLIVAGLKDKKVLSQATLNVSLRRTGYAGWQMRQETVDLNLLDTATIETIRQQVTGALSTALIRRLLLLPLEDLDYLLKDLPEESVQAIINAAQSH